MHRGTLISRLVNLNMRAADYVRNARAEHNLMSPGVAVLHGRQRVTLHKTQTVIVPNKL